MSKRMKVAIMQPYFLPYIGYFQLIHEADTFVIYDDIEYTKKGWINRNRIVNNKKVQLISIPLKKQSDFLPIRERQLSEAFDKAKLLRQIASSYRKTDNFDQTFELVERIINYPSVNLFSYIFHSIKEICAYLELSTPLVISSSLDYDASLKSEEKVIDICRKLNGDVYVNPIGGKDLYSTDTFSENNIDLRFLKTSDFQYNQLMDEFEPFLSIVDVLMMNSREEVKKMLEKNYKLIE